MSASKNWSRRVSLGVAAVDCVIVMAAVVSPSPLMLAYRHRFEIDTTSIVWSFTAYVTAACLTLVILGRASDHLGRRPVALCAMALLAAGSALLVIADSAGVLVLARAVHGVGAGLMLSAVAPWVIDLQARGNRILGPTVVAIAPTAGATVGLLLAGGLGSIDPEGALTLVPGVFSVLALIAGVATAFARETVATRPGLRASLLPRLALPRVVRRPFLAAAPAFAAAWGFGGILQGIGALVAASTLSVTGLWESATVIAVMVGCSVIGGPAVARMTDRAALILGAVVLGSGAIGVLVASLAGQLTAFLAASALAGLGYGAAYAGGLRLAGRRVTPEGRAAFSSVTYLTSFGGTALLTLTAGILAPQIGVTATVVGASAIIALLCALSAICAAAQRGE